MIFWLGHKFIGKINIFIINWPPLRLKCDILDYDRVNSGQDIRIFYLPLVVARRCSSWEKMMLCKFFGFWQLGASKCWEKVMLLGFLALTVKEIKILGESDAVTIFDHWQLGASRCCVIFWVLAGRGIKMLGESDGIWILSFDCYGHQNLGRKWCGFNFRSMRVRGI